ncbi:MAG: transcriptional regulator, partial [Thermodesulfobacteriota bacterium]|nr:transcriptional regulator [Thermodesulfobacteriota bacterium]
MRGDQLSRQWRILRQIEASKYGLTAAEIAELGGVSLKTGYRDLDDLQLAGFPLYADKGESGRRWKLIDTYRFDLPQPFTFTELMSLHMSRDLFKVFKGTAFYESMQSLFEKVRATLPPQTLTYLDKVQSAFHMGIKPYNDYARFRGIIDQVNQAVVECRRVEMAYRSLNARSETLRKFDPYKVWFYDGTIYIIGRCHLRTEVRTFVMDRIKMLRLTQETFTVPDNFDLKQYLRHSFKVMKDELYDVKIWISPAWSRYIGEKIWHESQRIRKLPDGSLEMTLRVAGLEEIKQWVMGMGTEARVLEPESLKELVKAELHGALSYYTE